VLLREWTCVFVSQHATVGRCVMSAQINAELLAACEAAKEWIDLFGEHAPITFGGEAELSDQLTAAINKAKAESAWQIGDLSFIDRPEWNEDHGRNDPEAAE
jgi:hypothetical protein